MEIVELPDDLKKLDPINNQKEFVNALVHKWNGVVESVENQTILFSKMVVKALEGHEDAVISIILEKIRNHPDLRLTISKDRIWQGVRLIRSRPDIVNAPAVSFEPTEMVYRKRDGTKNYEFYFELYKCNIPEGIRGILEVQGKGQSWTVKELKQKIEEYRQEKLDPATKVRLKKRDDIREIFKLIRDIQPEGVTLCLEKVREIYEKYKYAPVHKEERTIRPHTNTRGFL